MEDLSRAKHFSSSICIQVQIAALHLTASTILQFISSDFVFVSFLHWHVCIFLLHCTYPPSSGLDSHIKINYFEPWLRQCAEILEKCIRTTSKIFSIKARKKLKLCGLVCLCVRICIWMNLVRDLPFDVERKTRMAYKWKKEVSNKTKIKSMFSAYLQVYCFVLYKTATPISLNVLFDSMLLVHGAVHWEFENV